MIPIHKTESANSVAGAYVDGPPGTIISAADLNAIQEEICNVIINSGQALLTTATDTTYQQLWDAVGSAATLVKMGVMATAAEINTVAETSTSKNSHTHPLADGATDVTATAAEINTACDGTTSKNSHTHPLADGATDVTATFTEINTTVHNCTATSTEINTVCDGDTAKNNHIHIASSERIRESRLVYQSTNLVTVSFPWTEPGGTAWANVIGLDISKDVAGGGNVKNGTTPDVASTWYYLFMSNLFTVTQPVASEFIFKDVATVEAGYTLIGSVYNTVSQNIRPFDQQRDMVIWRQAITIASGTTLMAWTDLILTDIACNKVIPTNASIVKLAGHTVCKVVSSDTVIIQIIVKRKGDVLVDDDAQILSESRVYYNDEAANFGTRDVTVDNTGSIEYKVNGVGPASIYNYIIYVTGYYI